MMKMPYRKPNEVLNSLNTYSHKISCDSLDSFLCLKSAPNSMKSVWFTPSPHLGLHLQGFSCSALPPPQRLNLPSPLSSTLHSSTLFHFSHQHYHHPASFHLFYFMVFSLYPEARMEALRKLGLPLYT